MVRTQIQLTDEQARAIKRVAAERGVSMAALIRQAVEVVLEAESPDARWERALAVIGKHGSSRGDLAVEHDRHLVEALTG